MNSLLNFSNKFIIEFLYDEIAAYSSFFTLQDMGEINFKINSCNIFNKFFDLKAIIISLEEKRIDTLTGKKCF